MAPTRIMKRPIMNGRKKSLCATYFQMQLWFAKRNQGSTATRFRAVLMALCGLALFSGSSPAQTKVLFNNITTPCSPYSNTPPTCGYFPIFGPTGDGAIPYADSVAAQFIPVSGGSATDARVVVVGNNPLTYGSFNVAIYADSGGIPGTQIGSAVTNLSQPVCCLAGIVTAPFSQPIALTSGTKYWLAVSAAASSTYLPWVVGGATSVPTASSLTQGTYQPCNWCDPGLGSVQFAVDSVTPPFLITTSSLPIAQSGQPYSATFTASGGAGGYKWSLLDGSLPAGVTLSQAGVLATTGMPAASSGPYPLTVQVIDSTGNSTAQSFTLTVTTLLQISTATLPNAVSGQAYSTNLSARGGSGAGYAWSVVSGTLPTGFSLSTSGVLTSAPGSSAPPKAYSFTVQVTDSAANKATQPLTLTVTQPSLSLSPLTLKFQISAGSPKQSQSLQVAGTAGTTWQAAASATGGSWLSANPASGSVPGVLTVTADAGGLTPGTYTGTITVAGSGAVSLSATANITLTVTPAGSPYVDPVVYSANNSADYSTVIAQGSLFVIFGYSLGPATLAEVSSFPLPNVLAGTSVTVTSGSTTLNCPMIYTSSGQVAAILPSNTPLGEAAVNVSYLGVQGYPSYQSITVVQSSVGIFTTTSNGLGAGIFTALDGTLKTYATSAKPGEVLTAWATGLGPISSPDNMLPTTFPNFSGVQVWVGGQSAPIVYAGRSGCCAAIDQITFTVPTIANGCNVPVVVTRGGNSSNTVSMPVSATGGACSDTGPTLPTSVLTKAAAGQPVKVAAIAIGPTSLGGGASAPKVLAKRLSAEFHTPVSEADVARLMQAYATRNPKAIRAALTKYASRWKMIDSRTKARIARDLVGQTQEGAAAFFDTLNNEATATMIASAQLPVTGSCVVLPSSIPSSLGRIGTPLDAGSSLLLTGAANSYMLTHSPNGYHALFDSSVIGPGIPLGSYTISGTGGKDVGAFSATITVGSHLAISNKSSLNTIDRTQPLTLTWSGGVSGSYVLIEGNSPNVVTYTNTTYQRIPNANFACVEDAGKGTFTIPGYILSALNPTAGGKGTLAIANHPLSNQITIPGIDLAYFVDGSSDSVSVTFK